MISYENIYGYSAPGGGTSSPLGDMHRFRRVEREGFNTTDVIDVRFFKLLFYFYNDTEDNTQIDWFNGGSSGLLAPTWLDNPTGDYYKYNSAWAYLKSNYEEERADALVKFVSLLSQISSESPWYFQSISGIDEALTREKWTVNEDRKKISIKCMNDPVDHRIESLLSLYRSIVWSHTRKCEVLPANLRKFDMGMFVFSGLFNGLIVNDQKGWAPIGKFDVNTDRANYKYIEFHNCEINLDSIKSGFGEMSNESGFEQSFTIDIYFDDCYEYEYNPFIMRSFGDFFIWDAWTNSGRNDEGDVMGDSPEFWIDDINKVTNIESATEKDINNRIYPVHDEIKKQEMNKNNKIRPTKKEGYFERILKSAKNSFINSITGGLGNIYGKGAGLKGLTDALEDEWNKQTRSLQNKVTGNINDSATKISKGIVSTITTPALGTLKTTGTFMADVVDAATNVTVKPVLGNIKAAETTSQNITAMGTQPISEAGEYISNESKKLGNIAYDSQVNLANQIGKNRLKTNLGKL